MAFEPRMSCYTRKPSNGELRLGNWKVRSNTHNGQRDLKSLKRNDSVLLTNLMGIRTKVPGRIKSVDLLKNIILIEAV